MIAVKNRAQDSLRKAGLLFTVLFLTACVGADSGYDDKASAQLRKCRNLADYIAVQYVTPAHDLPVQHEGGTGFVTIKVPSLYEVTYQHKGHQAVIDTCLARHTSS